MYSLPLSSHTRPPCPLAITICPGRLPKEPPGRQRVASCARSRSRSDITFPVRRPGSVPFKVFVATSCTPYVNESYRLLPQNFRYRPDTSLHRQPILDRKSTRLNSSH